MLLEQERKKSEMFFCCVVHTLHYLPSLLSCRHCIFFWGAATT